MKKLLRYGLIVGLLGASAFADDTAAKAAKGATSSSINDPRAVNVEKKGPTKKLSELVGRYSELMKAADSAKTDDEKANLKGAAAQEVAKILSGMQSGEFKWENEPTANLQSFMKMIDSKEVKDLGIDLSKLKDRMADRLKSRRDAREPGLFKKKDSAEPAPQGRPGIFKGRQSQQPNRQPGGVNPNHQAAPPPRTER